MVGSIFAGALALIMTVAVPALLLSPAKAEAETPRMLIIEADKSETMVRLQTEDGETELPLERYLVGVVLSEMPMSFSEEALKAQAVAARTFTLRQLEHGKHEGFDLCGQSSCCQAWTGEEALSEKLGDSWKTYWDKASEAVMGTAGQVLTYEGELIEAVYFSCSGGATEDAVAVWGSEVPYLQSVTSPGEEQAGKYHTTVPFSKTEFQSLIHESRPLANLSGKPEKWLGAEKRTEGGGVAEMTIGGQVFRGTELRQLFGLNSTNFTLEVRDEELVFSVYGYGHRVGMSQYGANAMAMGGKSYQEILSHYYEGVEIEYFQ